MRTTKIEIISLVISFILPTLLTILFFRYVINYNGIENVDEGIFSDNRLIDFILALGTGALFSNLISPVYKIVKRILMRSPFL